MPQVIKSSRLFPIVNTSSDASLVHLHQKREKFKSHFYGHPFHRGLKNLAKLVNEAPEYHETPQKPLSSPGR